MLNFYPVSTKTLEQPVQEKTYPFEVHRLPVEKIDTHALYVMEKLKAAGYVSYLVGGSVRDLLLGKKPKDFDISTSAHPEQIKSLFRNCILIGRRFRLAHIRFGKKILEVSTFRSGIDLDTENLIVRDNEWGLPEEDALRRDFTINGLFYDPSTQHLIDYVGGYPDIEKKLLRTIGPAYVRFKQDPVRMIRLLKFQARFGCAVDPDAHIALLECRQEIVKSSPARILEELLRMLESGSSEPFIRLMADHGMLAYLVPELAHFLETPQGEKIYEYLQEVDSLSNDPSCLIPQRSVLMSCLIYPLLEKRLEEVYLAKHYIPHLGEIHSLTRELLTELFHGFFYLPKKMRASITSILGAQFRLTPFNKSSKRKRIPKDPDFPLGLEFLKLRSYLEPGLQQVHSEWLSAVEDSTKTHAKRRTRRPH